MAMTVEVKDLKLLKGDYTHRLGSLKERVARLEKRVDWIEKLLWLSAGAVISWLVAIALEKI
jgi:hypothetical protein